MDFITIVKGDYTARVTERSFKRVWSRHGWERAQEQPTGPQRRLDEEEAKPSDEQQAQKKASSPSASSKRKSGEESGE